LPNRKSGFGGGIGRLDVGGDSSFCGVIDDLLWDEFAPRDAATNEADVGVFARLFWTVIE
jgi:hypothetical protein